MTETRSLNEIEASEQLRQQMDYLIELAKLYKPNDRSERDRLFAIWITDLQKVRAWFLTELHITDNA